MNWTRNLKVFTKLGVATLMLGALAMSGNAQTAYRGSFTLPFETHWGAVTLPAGDYTFSLPSATVPYTLYVHGKGVSAIIMAATTDDRGVSDHARLNLVDTTDAHTVQTFDAPELGVTFVYPTPGKKHVGRKGNSEEAASPAAPGTVTENKTTIEVRTAGR